MNNELFFKTSKEVFAVIWAKHGHEFIVYSGFTNLEPSHLCSYPCIETTWGFEGADFGMIRHKTTWEHNNRKETEKHEYWLVTGEQPMD